MKSLANYIRIVFVLCIVFIMTSCQEKANGDNVWTQSVVSGPFKVIIETKKISNDSILVTRKLKYNGNQDIQIHHSDPLISIAVSPTGEPIVHTFDDVRRTLILKSNETLTYNVPVEFKATQGNTKVSVLANFKYEDKVYSIPLEFEY